MATATFKGDPVELSGTEQSVGDTAPDFHLQSNALEEISLSTKPGRVRVIATVPSLDTSVCSVESKRFDDEAAKMTDADFYIVSMDLPFAAKRWCGSEDAEHIHTLSDHRTGTFGQNYGVLISGGPLDRILTRAVFVVGKDNVLKHVEYCPEIAEHPNYDAALEAARAANAE